MRLTFVGALFFVVAVGAYAGCTQDFGQFEGAGGAATASGTGSAQGGNAAGTGGGGGGCQSDAACNDDNPCTTDACTGGVCQNVVVADGPLAGFTQIAGDCTSHDCVGGQELDVADDTDLPDDANPCTADTCDAGQKVFTPTSEGMVCAGPQSMCMDGLCVGCHVGNPATCPPGNDCTTYTCDDVGGGLGSCTVHHVADGTLAATQTPQDCQQVVCDGQGGTRTRPDGSDLPTDGIECTDDVCTNGTPSNPPTGIDAPCGSGEFCDGAGQCVECTKNGQCGGGGAVCFGSVCCTPESQDQACGDGSPGSHCSGSQPDGCGGTVSCAGVTCASPTNCSNGTCGCAPKTVAEACGDGSDGTHCTGTQPDGCGGTVSCAGVSCTSPNTCMGGLCQCNAASTTVACGDGTAGTHCAGTQPDGCGGVVDCSGVACTGQNSCTGGLCTCTPKTVAQACGTGMPGDQCTGTAPDGCGGTVDCTLVTCTNGCNNGSGMCKP